MEDRRGTTYYEVIDTDKLIEQAFELYDEYLAKGLEVPAEEVRELQEKTAVLEQQNKRKFNNLRSTIGDIAFGGQESLSIGLMRLLFGDRDAKLLENFLVLSNATQMVPQEYSISNMASLYEEANEQRIAGDLRLDPKQEELFKAALRGAEAFLAAAGGPEIRERVFIQQEMLNQLGTQDIEKTFSTPPTLEQIKEHLKQNVAAIIKLFKRLKTSGFDSAPETVSGILSLVNENEELRRKLLITERATPENGSSSSRIETVRGRAYQKLSTDLGHQIGDKTLRKPVEVEKEIEVQSGSKKKVRRTILKPLDEGDWKTMLKQMQEYEYKKQNPTSEQGGGQ